MRQQMDRQMAQLHVETSDVCQWHLVRTAGAERVLRRSGQRSHISSRAGLQFVSCWCGNCPDISLLISRVKLSTSSIPLTATSISTKTCTTMCSCHAVLAIICRVITIAVKERTQKGQELSCRKETVRLLRGTVLAKYNLKTTFCRHYRSVFNHCDVIGLQSYRIQLYSEISQGHRCRYQSKHPMSYRLEVIADYCLNFGHCIFEPPWGRAYGTIYTVHLKLIGKFV